MPNNLLMFTNIQMGSSEARAGARERGRGGKSVKGASEPRRHCSRIGSLKEKAIVFL